MKRRIFCILIILVMVLSVFAISGCGVNALNKYKAEGKQTIQTYGDDKGVANYSEEGWAVICNAVTQGKEAVDAAISKIDVDATVTKAKEAIDDVHILITTNLVLKIPSL